MTLGESPTNATPALNLTDDARNRLFQALGDEKGPEKPGPLEGVRAKFAFAAKKEVKQERNVLGFFPGTDPEKKKEIIIYSAHYDHVGVDDKGVIFNGSDDNASGTSALLEIAEAFGEGPRPARERGVPLGLGGGEGLLGSRWFADHSPLPAEYKIVADINLDMVSRNDGNQVGITPSPKHGDYSNLIPAAEAHLKTEGVEALFNADEFYARDRQLQLREEGDPDHLLLRRGPRGLPQVHRRRGEGRLREGRADRARRLPARLPDGPGGRGPEEDQAARGEEGRGQARRREVTGSAGSQMPATYSWDVPPHATSPWGDGVSKHAPRGWTGSDRPSHSPIHLAIYETTLRTDSDGRIALHKGQGDDRAAVSEY